MKALITGSEGFVGKYHRQELTENGYEVVGLCRRGGEGCVAADLMRPEQAAQAVEDVRPDLVFHLAGQANVKKSWSEPAMTFETNVLGTLNLLEAVRAYRPEIPMVIVGSSDQYGALGAAGADVTEDMALAPGSPYAVSKSAQEQLALLYDRAYGMSICLTRSFNHAGPGQKEGYMISDFCAGIARVECGLQDCLTVGNLTSRRDFTHVRDVVRAYRLLAEKGRHGEIYNIGSGMTHSGQEILDKLCAMAACPIPVRQDPAKMRPSDTPVVCCNHAKLTRDTGWQPAIGLDDMLQETLDDWRKQIRKG